MGQPAFVVQLCQLPAFCQLVSGRELNRPRIWLTATIHGTATENAKRARMALAPKRGRKRTSRWKAYQHSRANIATNGIHVQGKKASVATCSRQRAALRKRRAQRTPACPSLVA